MRAAEFHDHVGPENICGSVAEALGRARFLYPEVAKQHPPGTTWGRRSTDILPAAELSLAASSPHQGETSPE
jgi:hypothetical protein